MPRPYGGLGGSADEDVPPQLGVGVSRRRRRRGLRGDRYEAGLAFSDKPELLAGGGLDVFV